MVLFIARIPQHGRLGSMHHDSLVLFLIIVFFFFFLLAFHCSELLRAETKEKPTNVMPAYY